MANSWTQPLCRPCFSAFSLGAGQSPHREPAKVIGAHDPCLLCGEPTAIFIRVDPALTEGLKFARPKED